MNRSKRQERQADLAWNQLEVVRANLGEIPVELALDASEAKPTRSDRFVKNAAARARRAEVKRLRKIEEAKTARLERAARRRAGKVVITSTGHVADKSKKVFVPPLEAVIERVIDDTPLEIALPGDTIRPGVDYMVDPSVGVIGKTKLTMDVPPDDMSTLLELRDDVSPTSPTDQFVDYLEELGPEADMHPTILRKPQGE